MSYIAQVIHHTSNGFCSQKKNKRQTSKKSPVSSLIRLTRLGFKIMSYIHPGWTESKLADLWFSVIQPRPAEWTKSFWVSADRHLELHLPDKTITLYLWGQGPLLVCLHGWAGSGTQFRNMIPVLVKAGYQVACFDAPSHGQNPGRSSHLLNFSNSLLAIQDQLGPVHTIIAHSFGAMATLMASYQGLNTQQMVFIAPGLDINELYDSFSEKLNLNQKLKKAVHQNVGSRMRAIAEIDDPWAFFQADNMLAYASTDSLMIYDRDDEEIAFKNLEKISAAHEDLKTFVTEKLGHNKILKDGQVINRITDWIGACSAMKNEKWFM